MVETSVQKQIYNNNQNRGGNSMRELLKKRLKNQKGLTLIELLAVIVILAIVAAIAIPAIGNIIENSRYNGVKSDAINVLNAANLYFTDNPTETEVTVAQLGTDGYLDSPGKINQDPNAKVTRAAGGNKLTTTAIKYSGNKTVTFSDATVNGINADTNKGSGQGNYTISN